MNADVEKVVERFELLAVDHEPDGWPAVRMRDLTLAAKALRDQEAEIARLRKIEEERWAVVATRNAAVMRAEKADALLRHVVAAHTGENVDGCDMRNADIDHITAHLGGEHE